MDEWSGYLRIATTRGRVPDPKVESAVSILAEGESGNLVRVGAVENIAPGEDIRAVRFDDDRGYVVTFKKTDPLFVLDLYEPAHPAILGELKIPGFSTYIHRIDPDHLLSIGFDANDHGSFAYFDGVILQLFDVKNPTDPQPHPQGEDRHAAARARRPRPTTSRSTTSPTEGLLAIPMTICEGGGDGRNGDQLAFSGLLVYDVDLEKGFTRLGGVDHGTKGASCSTWWSNAQLRRQAQRLPRRSRLLDRERPREGPAHEPLRRRSRRPLADALIRQSRLTGAPTGVMPITATSGWVPPRVGDPRVRDAGGLPESAGNHHQKVSATRGAKQTQDSWAPLPTNAGHLRQQAIRI